MHSDKESPSCGAINECSLTDLHSDDVTVGMSEEVRVRRGECVTLLIGEQLSREVSELPSERI